MDTETATHRYVFIHLLNEILSAKRRSSFAQYQTYHAKMHKENIVCVNVGKHKPSTHMATFQWITRLRYHQTVGKNVIERSVAFFYYSYYFCCCASAVRVSVCMCSSTDCTMVCFIYYFIFVQCVQCYCRWFFLFNEFSAVFVGCCFRLLCCWFFSLLRLSE